MVIINNAIENIKTNKLRVIVAMVWIVLGITSVVVVSSIGNGIEEQGKKASQNPEFRTSNIMFYPNYESNFDATFFEAFNQQHIGIIAGMKGVERVTPKYGNSEGGYGTSLYIDGSYVFTKTTEYKEDKKLEVDYGRLFSLEDLDRNTIVLDNEIAFRLGNTIPKNAIGKSINIDGEEFEVIGVLKETKSDVDIIDSGYTEPEVYLPKKAIEELESRKSFGGPITSLEVLIENGYDTAEVGDDILKALQEGVDKESGDYGQTGNGSGDHQLRIMQQTINRFTSILSKVSLFIGGIGIMNIMYMSVAERKREIGIRRAIGAEPKDILIQFLIETIVITILGGIVGIVVGTIAASQVGPYLGVPAIPSVGVYTKAVVVSVLTGAIFGAIPALKAAKLDPIKAIQG